MGGMFPPFFLMIVLSLVIGGASLSLNPVKRVVGGVREGGVELKTIAAGASVIARVGGLVDASITGGLLSGGLHAVTGPDHIAAVLPPSMGHSWFYGMRIGAAWGLGHGVSATALGLAAIALKGQMSARFTVLQKLSSLADSMVGFSLLFIGALGMKEARTMNTELVSRDSGAGTVSSRSGRTGSSGSGINFGVDNLAIFGNGLLHGFSLDGAPSIAPALAMSSVRSALWFLAAYCIGTMVTMAITAGAVGESSKRLVQKSNNPKLPKRLCLGSSIFALLAGTYWIIRSLFL